MAARRGSSEMDPRAGRATAAAACGLLVGAAGWGAWEAAREADIGAGVVLVGPVNLGRAPVEEIELLPGVGPALARRVVEERVRAGRFESAADLARVLGIGPQLVARLAPFVEP